MKKLVVLTFICLLCAASIFAQSNGSQPRVSQLFNFGWKFQPADVPDAQDPSLNDAGWRPLDLPHDFQIDFYY
jgi:beta-galactosidase